MRSDMFKVIVERPRLRFPKKVGSAYPRGRLENRLERDLETAPRSAGIAFLHREKHLNENLAPLERFLRSRVGKPYDRVRSEIFAQLSMNSAVQKHVADHLPDLLWENTVLVEGRLHGRWKFGGFYPLEDAAGNSRYGRRLYVCPRTGILRELPPRKRARPAPPEVFPLGERSELRRIDGVWTHVRFARLPDTPAKRAGCFDVLLASQLTSRWFGPDEPFQRFYGRSDRYAVELREPGLRELAALRRARSK